MNEVIYGVSGSGGLSDSCHILCLRPNSSVSYLVPEPSWELPDVTHVVSIVLLIWACRSCAVDWQIATEAKTTTKYYYPFVKRGPPAFRSHKAKPNPMQYASLAERST